MESPYIKSTEILEKTPNQVLKFIIQYQAREIQEIKTLLSDKIDQLETKLSDAQNYLNRNFGHHVCDHCGEYSYKDEMDYCCGKEYCNTCILDGKVDFNYCTACRQQMCSKCVGKFPHCKHCHIARNFVFSYCILCSHGLNTDYSESRPTCKDCSTTVF